jgi:hypothetical protein
MAIEYCFYLEWINQAYKYFAWKDKCLAKTKHLSAFLGQWEKLKFFIFLKITTIVLIFTAMHLKHGCTSTSPNPSVHYGSDYT